MTYCTPADVGVSDNRQDHINRGSAEPGTDYETAYGTDLRAPYGGRVILVDHSPAGPEGRRISFLLDNGEVIDWIHLARIFVGLGHRIEWGARGIALSGASGWGQDWYYGPHVHVTRRVRAGLPYSQTADFEHLAAAPTPTRPIPANTAPIPSEEDDMLALRIDDGKGTKHLCTLGIGVFRHMIWDDDPERMKNIIRSDDAWTDIHIDELPRLLTTYGCDVQIYRLEDGEFKVRNSADNTVRTGGMWRH